MTSHPQEKQDGSDSSSSICSPQTDAQQEPVLSDSRGQIRPALPLKTSGTGYLVDAKNTVLCYEPNIEHQAYIVHAANAYPTLVSALIDALEFIEPFSDVMDGSYGEQHPNRCMSLSGDIERLLRELGELPK